MDFAHPRLSSIVNPKIYLHFGNNMSITAIPVCYSNNGKEINRCLHIAQSVAKGKIGGPHIWTYRFIVQNARIDIKFINPFGILIF